MTAGLHPVGDPDDERPVRSLVSPPPDQQHRGQVRIAYRLADSYAGKLLFVPKIGWHRWDGKRWARDEKGAATRAVLTVLRRALSESLTDPDLRSDVRKCEGAAAIRGVLEIAGTLEEFVAAADELDADPYLLNTASGTLDLRTGRVRPPDPADRITKVTRGAWRPEDAGVGAWQEFLEQVLPDVEVRGFLQRTIGVALLGKVIEHVLPILTGTGGNGKGVMYSTVMHALGDYAASAEPDLFMARDGAHPTGQMDLFGRRLVVVSESDQGRKLAEATMKRLTGGDKIKARYMGKDFVEFEPSHTAVLVTNHLPKVSGDDDAVWRRVRVIPFAVTIPVDEQDGHLAEHLELEADVVLAWAVAGYSDYVARGNRLAEPDSVVVATDAYRADSDPVGRFLDDACLINPNVKATTGELFARWQEWSVLEGAESISQKVFGQALDRRGLIAGPAVHGKRWRKGIALAAADDADQGRWDR